MLEHKGVEYRRIDLVVATHRTILRALGFPRKTVPAIKLDGAKVQGTRKIALALDALIPSSPLFPADPDQRREVEQAEAWGEEVLQAVPRRLVMNALKRDSSRIASYLEGARIGIPRSVAARTAAPFTMASRHYNRASIASTS
jgi:glutathione S-transferase